MCDVRENGKRIKSHVPCPCEGCGSSDAASLYQKPDGSIDGYCFSCNQYFRPEGQEAPAKAFISIGGQVSDELTIADILAMESPIIADRRLKQETAVHFGVKQDEENRYYPVYAEGKLVGYKVRKLPKDFNARPIGCTTGHIEMFGQHLSPAGGKLVLVTIGEEDAMAVWQMTKHLSTRDRGYTAVSFPHGGNLRNFKDNLAWFEKFEKVVFCVDQEDKDNKIAEQAAALLSIGKAFIAKFSEKDASDMCKAGKYTEFMEAINKARDVNPSGIVRGIDTWNRWANRPYVRSVPFPKFWGLNELTYGMRLGELDTFTAGSGTGKSQLIREIQYHLLKQTTDNIGIIALEEPIEDTIGGLLSLALSKRVLLPDTKSDQEEQRKAWEEIFGSNRFYMEEAFGSIKESSLVQVIRHLAHGCGCKYIFLDHLHIAISEFADQGNERERIDTLMSRLKSLTQELGIWLGLIVHLRKTGGQGESFEEGGQPSLDDLRGSGAIKQLSNTVYSLVRNQLSDNEHERNTSTLYVLKCRFTGRTGKAGHLYFDGATGRLVEPKGII